MCATTTCLYCTLELSYTTLGKQEHRNTGTQEHRNTGTQRSSRLAAIGVAVTLSVATKTKMRMATRMAMKMAFLPPISCTHHLRNSSTRLLPVALLLVSSPLLLSFAPDPRILVALPPSCRLQCLLLCHLHSHSHSQIAMRVACTSSEKTCAPPGTMRTLRQLCGSTHLIYDVYSVFVGRTTNANKIHKINNANAN